MIMKRKLPQKQNAKVSLKNGRIKGPITQRRCQSLATPKRPQGKTPSSFAMCVDKLKLIDACSCTITEKRIMDILFEVEIGTTYVTPFQRQHSISMRCAEAQYLNVTTPVQGQYLSLTQTQNFWMDLHRNG